MDQSPCSVVVVSEKFRFVPWVQMKTQWQWQQVTIQTQSTEDTDVTELEQAKAALQQAETERDNALNELKQFKADKRNDDISALKRIENTIQC
jgi:hypothetical protein